MQDYNFERDFRVMSIPPFPKADYRIDAAQKKRPIATTHAYRVKRAKQPPPAQRTLKRHALVRRARKAAAAGRVQFCDVSSFCLLFMPQIPFFNRVVGTGDY